MKREDVVGLVRTIVSVYPNWKPENLTDTVDAWFWILGDYEIGDIMKSLDIYIKTNRSGFAPSVSQLIDGLYKPSEIVNGLTEGEAWALVKKAIQNGNYEAREEFERLPEAVQKAVGDYRMIREWAATDSDTVNTVIMSNFQRCYRAVLQKSEFVARVPEIIKDRIESRDRELQGIEVEG